MEDSPHDGAPRTCATVGNVIGGEERPASRGGTFEKLAPATGEVLCAASPARRARTSTRPSRRRRPRSRPGRRGRSRSAAAILRRIAQLLERDREQVAAVVSAETGKSPKDAKGETDGAIELGYFIAGEGRRFYGKTMPSATPNRQAMTIRQPLGVAGPDHRREHADRERRVEGLPRAALRERGGAEGLRGRARDRDSRSRGSRPRPACRPASATSSTASARRRGSRSSRTRGSPSSRFTGSTAVGRLIARVAGERLAKVCLELGGKNPLVVCDDADLEQRRRGRRALGLLERGPALRRRARGSIVFDAVYDRFRELLVERARAQKVGPDDEHDFGPVINERQLENMLAAVERARAAGATVAHRRRAARPARLLHGADDRRGRRRRLGDLLHRALRADHDAPSRRATSRRRSRRRTRARTA